MMVTTPACAASHALATLASMPPRPTLLALPNSTPSIAAGVNVRISLRERALAHARATTALNRLVTHAHMCSPPPVPPRPTLLALPTSTPCIAAGVNVRISLCMTMLSHVNAMAMLNGLV